MGIVAALHTWSRTLAFHAHVHCLVSGGGLTVRGQWRAVRRGYLLPVAVGRALFRGKVLGAIETLWLTGRLQVPPHWPEDGVRRVLVKAARQQWNIRIAERYRHGRGVVKYLARYVRGGPIKEQRLVAFDGRRVTVRYGNHRERDAQGNPQQQELTLAVEEFLSRWSAHVPVPGVHTVRAWGLYASPQRQRLEQCREQLPEEDTARERPPRTAEETPDHARPWEVCPVCHQRMVVTHVVPRAGAPPAQRSWPAAA